MRVFLGLGSSEPSEIAPKWARKSSRKGRPAVDSGAMAGAIIRAD